MIAVKLEGRLGNQLFQYAFIYTAAKKLNTQFYIDKGINEFILPKYFVATEKKLFLVDKVIFSISGFKNLFNHHAKVWFYNLLQKAFRLKEVTFSNNYPPLLQLNTIQNNTLYKGAFYSESYFKDFKDEIRALYRVNDVHVAAFEQVKKQLSISKKKAVIHIRRDDYVGLGWELPLSYYKKAIETINNEEIAYIFISDDRAFIEAEFSYLHNKYISSHNEIIDLQFLINADICILSNSSFSWWGAWLNNNENKQVFAPKNWLGYKDQKEFPIGVANHINFKWIQV